ncbi:MAG: hypothetical protein QM765_53595 [Myxococcales bacterium]
MIWVPRRRLLLLALGLPAACGASLGLTYLVFGHGLEHVAGGLAAVVCLSGLAALFGYRSSFVFDAKVRVVQQRSTLFGRPLRARHHLLATTREVEVLSSAVQTRDTAPLDRRWYQVRVGEVVVAPMLAGGRGHEAAVGLARRLAAHLSLPVVER